MAATATQFRFARYVLFGAISAFGTVLGSVWLVGRKPLSCQRVFHRSSCWGREREMERWKCDRATRVWRSDAPALPSGASAPMGAPVTGRIRPLLRTF